jgi:hypothetical protein
MANEMFTTRSGRQVQVPTLAIPPVYVTSLMRLQEDYVERGEHLSLLGVLLDVIDKGQRQVKNQWKNGDLNKNRRDFSKAVLPYMRDAKKYAKEIEELAIRFGLVEGTQIDLSTPEPTDEELEVATAPDKA